VLTRNPAICWLLQIRITIKGAMIKRFIAKKQKMKGIKYSTRAYPAVKHSVMIPAWTRKQASRKCIEYY
jgi:hypothetical protein